LEQGAKFCSAIDAFPVTSWVNHCLDLTFINNSVSSLLRWLLTAGAGRGAIQYLLAAGSTAANPPHAAAAVDTWDRQTDGHRTVT